MSDVTLKLSNGFARDPDLVLASLGKPREFLRSLETDEEIFTALGTRRDALIATEWRLEDPESDLAELIEEELRPIIADAMGYAWRALPYGFSVFDVTYKVRDDGRFGIDSVRDMPIRLFRFDPFGQAVYMRPGGDPRGEYLDPLKLVLTRNSPSTDNPFGEALLSRLYWAWFFRQNLWRFRMEYLEKFVDPMIAGKVAAPAEFVKAIQGLGFQNVVAVGKDEQIEAINAQAAGEMDAAEKALNSRIQRAVLGQTLTSDVQGGGSFAAARVHNAVRMDRRDADIRMVSPSIQRIVDALGILNDPNYKPGDIRFVLADGKGLEEERASRDEKLLKTGRVRLSKEYFVRAYDYEEDEIEVVEPVAPQALAGNAGNDPGGDTAPADENDPPSDDPESDDTTPEADRRRRLAAVLAGQRERFTRKQQEVESIGNKALELARSPIPAGKIRSAILAASDPEDLADRLATLIGDLPPDEFQRIVEAAIFAADVLGYVHAANESGE